MEKESGKSGFRGVIDPFVPSSDVPRLVFTRPSSIPLHHTSPSPLSTTTAIKAAKREDTQVDASRPNGDSFGRVGDLSDGGKKDASSTEKGAKVENLVEDGKEGKKGSRKRTRKPAKGRSPPVFFSAATSKEMEKETKEEEESKLVNTRDQKSSRNGNESVKEVSALVVSGPKPPRPMFSYADVLTRKVDLPQPKKVVTVVRRRATEAGVKSRGGREKQKQLKEDEDKHQRGADGRERKTGRKGKGGRGGDERNQHKRSFPGEQTRFDDGIDDEGSDDVDMDRGIDLTAFIVENPRDRRRDRKALKRKKLTLNELRAQRKVQARNILDSTAPTRKRGKERIGGKKKTLTSLKKIIVREHQIRIQIRSSLKRKGKNAEDDKTELIDDSTHSSSQDDARSSQPSEHIAGTSVAKHPRISSKYREYAEQIITKELDRSVAALLKKLNMFQTRMFLTNPAKAATRRRFVTGLREVKNHIKLGFCKAVIIAPDIDQFRILDEFISEIRDASARKNVEVVFSMSKRRLAMLLQKPKHVRISAIGILNYDGAGDEFKLVKQLAEEGRRSFKAMLKEVSLDAKSEAQDDSDMHEESKL
eukprot:TRINITY_DN1159_c0_g2_i2.p1 TRINITY_DN1159_c0_g2~~TRINITY_DN1159_c0_g2_i2.p1  ORF type:complete len:625 (-),score=190.52 TRINITY_DN1159_c0_g2_i2:488-2257(-)